MTSEAEVERKVKEIIARVYRVKPEELKPETRFIDDLGADSITTIELVAEIEDVFGIEVPDEDVEKNQTVGQAVDYVVEKLKAAGKVK
ncbi:MAG: acyl carrier protein [Thermofilaceae archaeon]|nr:acyl carrier protein [Thermofilaceae archaeon]MCX8180872.1 acyl carrier protein [Thermofilaceae archaeon]MDW8003437.1 acyl carrier protein [Thermofilaceae archaeon]